MMLVSMALLTCALLAGFVTGWLVGRTFVVTMPNAFVAALVLVAGSLGGPVVTYTLLGPGRMSYAAALLVAGFAAGFTFWPMGQPQHERQWF